MTRTLHRLNPINFELNMIVQGLRTGFPETKCMTLQRTWKKVRRLLRRWREQKKHHVTDPAASRFPREVRVTSSRAGRSHAMLPTQRATQLSKVWSKSMYRNHSSTVTIERNQPTVWYSNNLHFNHDFVSFQTSLSNASTAEWAIDRLPYCMIHSCEEAKKKF